MSFDPRRSAFYGFIFLILSGYSEAKPVVLATIKPLSLIAQEVVGDLAEVDTLLPPSASPHDYPLKVSDHKRIDKADLLVWVGPELESFLQKATTNLTDQHLLTAYMLPQLNWPTETSHQEDKHHHERDPHLWLDPRNAAVLANGIANKMSLLDPTNKLRYQQNATSFSVKMASLDEKINQQLQPVKQRGFAVYHEGYAHFVGRYGLNQLDFVTFTPEQKPGARHIGLLREKLEKEGICLFLEPYVDSTSARDMAKELHLQVGTLDALGTQGVTSYAQLMETMANAFLTCLTNGRH